MHCRYNHDAKQPSSTVGCKLLIQKKKKLRLQINHLNEIKHLQRLVSNLGDHADIMIYIEDNGQVVQLQVEFSSLSAPTLRLVSDALMKARFTPGRVSGDAVPARIRWRVVMESASSFTMMN